VKASDLETMLQVIGETAEKILINSFRKALGIYYALWGFYMLITSMIYSVFYILGIRDPIITLTPSLAILIVFIYITMFKIFTGDMINRMTRVLKTFRIHDTRASRRSSRIFYFVLAILASLFIYVSIVSGEQQLYYIAMSIYVAPIIVRHYRILYSSPRIIEPKHYDIIAMVTLVSLVFAPLISILYYVFVIAWFYASIMSLLEVIENE
jgi:hypothetical protein